MIDKELANLKKDLPEFQIENYKREIYKKVFFKKINNSHKVGLLKISVASVFCFLLLFIVGISLYVFKSEQEKYQTACEFFEENELSIEGLSKSEIKEVYKDITTEKFVYKKTGEVLLASLKNKEPSFNIEMSTSDSISKFWEIWERVQNQEIPLSGVYYDYVSYLIENDITGIENDITGIEYAKYIFTKYKNANKCWSIEIPFSIDGYIEKDDYIIIYGTSFFINSYETSMIYVMKVDLDGKISWTQGLENTSYFNDIMINDDNTISVFSNNSFNILTFSQLNSNGDIIINNKNDLEKYIVQNITKINEYYLIYLIDMEFNTKFLAINEKGKVEKEFSYYDEKYRYFFTNVLEFGGQLYLSAYAVPYFDDIYYGRGEIKNILYYIEMKGNESITDEYLLSLFQENYKAILFSYNNVNGEFNKICSLDSAIGSKLLVEDNYLIWEVEYFQNMIYSPATNSFTFGGVTQVDNYIFDEYLQLTEVKKTNELRIFRR